MASSDQLVESKRADLRPFRTNIERARDDGVSLCQKEWKILSQWFQEEDERDAISFASLLII